MVQNKRHCNTMSEGREFAQKARNASRKLQALPTEERVAMLDRVADALLANEAAIMEQNKKVCEINHCYEKSSA